MYVGFVGLCGFVVLWEFFVVVRFGDQLGIFVEFVKFLLCVLVYFFYFFERVGGESFFYNKSFVLGLGSCSCLEQWFRCQEEIVLFGGL